jgi:undecaprenyl diphosphate synthase
MDGNGRWAERRTLPRSSGHRAGIDAVRRVVRAAADRGVSVLTLYAFSSDNWSRPEPEVRSLFWLLREYLRSETRALVEENVRVRVVGRRDRVPLMVRGAIEYAEASTAHANRLELRIALDYSARDAIDRPPDSLARTHAGAAATPLSRERFEWALGDAMHAAGSASDVDLLIRSGGERRLSDFLLWECAYAELWFSKTLWPDFSESHFDAALRWFATRSRRFGRVASPGDQPAAGA